MSESELKATLPGKLAALTPFTVTDKQILHDQLEEARQLGWASSWEELEIGLAAIGAPIIGMGSEVIGAVALVAPCHRIKVKEVSYYGNMVRETGLKISLVMGGQTPLEVTAGH